MTPAELNAEITAGPLAAALAASWAGGDDTATAARLNRRDRRGPIPIRELSSYCARSGITGRVLALDSLSVGQDIAPGFPMTLPIKGLTRSFMALLSDTYRLTEVDVDEEGFTAAASGLLAVGVLTQEQLDAVLLLAENRRSRADERGWTVTDLDVGNARKVA